MFDFHFSHPRLLYLALLLPPLLGWWVWQRRGSVRHPVASRLVGLPVGRARVSFLPRSPPKAGRLRTTTASPTRESAMLIRPMI